MADVAIKQAQVAATPAGYTVPGAQEIVLKAIKASYDGTGAGGSYVPVLQIVEPGGTIMIECALGSSVAAGASVDMSWFPGVDTGGTGTSVETTNTGATVDVNPTSKIVIGTGLTLTSPVAGQANVAASGGAGVTSWPAADQTDASIDTTSWTDSIEGAGHYTALAFPDVAVTYAAFAMGSTGDAFPRMVIGSSMGPDAAVAGGITMGEGTIDPAGFNGAWYGINETEGTGTASMAIGSRGVSLLVGGKDTNSGFGVCGVFNGLQLERAQGALGSNIIQYCGHGVPTIGGNVADLYWRNDPAGANTHLYQCTVAGAAGAATWVGIL